MVRFWIKYLNNGLLKSGTQILSFGASSDMKGQGRAGFNGPWVDKLLMGTPAEVT